MACSIFTCDMDIFIISYYLNIYAYCQHFAIQPNPTLACIFMNESSLLARKLITVRNLLAMSLYYNSENKLSSPKRAWKRLLSRLQLPKVLDRRVARSNTFPRRQNVYNKYHHYQHQQQQQMITRKRVDHQDIERSVGRKVFAPNDDQSSSDYKANNLMITRRVADAENVVEEDDDVVVGCTSMESAFVALRLHEVDAKAEEFIRRNKEAWRLERQKSVEEFFAMLARGS